MVRIANLQSYAFSHEIEGLHAAYQMRTIFYNKNVAILLLSYNLPVQEI